MIARIKHHDAVYTLDGKGCLSVGIYSTCSECHEERMVSSVFVETSISMTPQALVLQLKKLVEILSEKI